MGWGSSMKSLQVAPRNNSMEVGPASRSLRAVVLGVCSEDKMRRSLL